MGGRDGFLAFSGRIVPSDFAFELCAFGQQNGVLKEITVLPGEVPIAYIEQGLDGAIGEGGSHLHGFADVVRMRADAHRLRHQQARQTNRER